MLWVFPEYGGQVAVRLGPMKLVRQNLKTKTPGPWEVYDLDKDRGETTDLSAQHSELIRQAEELLRREVAPNTVFPVAIPGVTAAAH
jgi:arylsulfatase A-like enzyme